MADTTEWVHAVDAARHPVGSILGWPDKRSETGMLSGIVVEVDHLALRCRVRDLRAAIVGPSDSAMRKQP